MIRIKLFILLGFIINLCNLKAQNSWPFGDDYLIGSYSLYEYELNCPNETTYINAIDSEWNQIEINNGSNTQIAVRLKINELPNDAQIIVSINGDVEEVNWQEGETYIFKTLDNSGHCVVDGIGALQQANVPGTLLDVEISYEVLPNGEIIDVDDQLIYLNSILIARKEKYSGQALSVLIADIDKYQLPIYQVVPSHYKRNVDEYDNIDFRFSFAGTKNGKAVHGLMLINMTLDQTYSVDEFADFYVTRWELDLWVQGLKDIIGSNVVSDVSFIRFYEEFDY